MKRYAWAFLIEAQPNLNAVSIMIMAIDPVKCIFLALTDEFPAPPSVIRVRCKGSVSLREGGHCLTSQQKNGSREPEIFQIRQTNV